MSNKLNNIPLPERLRPRTFDDIVGNDSVIGENSALGKIIRSNNFSIPSLLLMGPPGVGKTTLAQVIANESGFKFERLSGVLSSIKELREVVESAKTIQAQENRSTLVLVDEIHRFNKAQQDAFLPHIESGLITIIGQTTENVSFRVRNALLSRLKVVELKPLNNDDIKQIINRALIDERGLGQSNLEITQEALEALARTSTGDARRALTSLEWSAVLAQEKASNNRLIEQSDVVQALSNQPDYFDTDGDYHYDCISAFIKSMRGSDPDAALYYMLRAIEGGEDPLFITRRMIIFASEDAGCDPRALEIAINADRAVERVGMPEGKIPIAQAVVYLASCPKSNASYLALREMEKVLESNPNLEIPKRLRNAPTELMKALGNSLSYKYPHDYPEAFVPERYLPKEIENTIVYKPNNRGVEIKIKERLDCLRKKIAEEKN